MPSPVYTNFQTQLPLFGKAPPFPWWSTSDDFLGPPHSLDLTGQFKIAHQLSNSGPSFDTPLVQSMGLLEPNMLKAMQLQDGFITPHIFDTVGTA
jgi:hypothetical protein